ncbi:MAG: hypothetical protein JRC90_10130 [Deltaproteobacteria bacterium]|nr:hypothetical protein [Deltaproteobacteria bacterium]
MCKTRYPLIIESEVLDEFKTLAIKKGLLENRVHGNIQNELNEAVKNHIKVMRERCKDGSDRPRT